MILMPLSMSAVEIKNPLAKDDGTGVNDFDDLIARIIEFVRTIAIYIAPILILVAAFYFMTAAGEPEKIKKAKQMLMWTLIGLGVILLAEAIINFFKIVFSVK